MKRLACAVTGLALLGLFASSAAWALVMSSINVSLTGEGTGKMGMTLDQSKVEAGRVTFIVKNDVTSETHEMLVIKVASADAELPYDAAKERVTRRRELWHHPRRGSVRIPAAARRHLPQRHFADLIGAEFRNHQLRSGHDLPYILFLPSYTAAAWYHKKLPADLQNGTLESAVEQARKFAGRASTRWP